MHYNGDKQCFVPNIYLRPIEIKACFLPISTKYDNFIKNIPVRSNASTRLNCTPKIKTTRRLITDVSNHDSQQLMTLLIH